MTPWYTSKHDDVPKRVCAALDDIIENDAARLAAYTKYGRMYGGRKRTPESAVRERVKKGASTTFNIDAPDEEILFGSTTNPLRMNVVKAAIDTVTAKVGKMKPRPTFLTSRGDYSLQRKAKNLQLFCDGAYHQSDAYEHGLDVFRDAMIYGTGVLVPYSRGVKSKRPRICTERTPVWEWFVDEVDAMYGSPRCLYRERYVARERVRLAWGDEVADSLKPISREERDGSYTVGSGGGPDDVDTDYVRVIEAWFRPLDPTNEPEEHPGKRGADPKRVVECGRHVLLVEGTVVEDEYFPFEEFPALFFHWSRPTHGFWGDSATREVEGIQVEINRLLHDVQRCMALVGKPIGFVHEEADLTPSEITNEIAKWYKWAGQIPPVMQTFQPISPQTIQHLWQLYAKAFEILGSNQLAASATAPPGLESGRALERLSEEHSERFMTVSRAFNSMMGEHLARRFLQLAKDLDERVDGGFKLRSPGSKVSIALKWSEVAIDSDAYVLQVFDTSVLPTLPSARLQEVERLQAAQMIDQTEARRLLDFPDLQESNEYATADYDTLMYQFERMLEDGEPTEPEPYQDLARAVTMGQAAILRAQLNGVPEDRIDLLRAFVATAVEMTQPPPQPAALPAGVAGPGGMDAGPSNAAAPIPGTPRDRRDDALSLAVPPQPMPVI